MKSQNLLDKLKSLSNHDPDIFYNTLENELTFAINKYIPLLKKCNIKLNKLHYIIKSIKYQGKILKDQKLIFMNNGPNTPDTCKYLNFAHDKTFNF